MKYIPSVLALVLPILFLVPAASAFAATNAPTDYDIFQACFGKSATFSNICAKADFNKDGIVNYADLALFKKASGYDINGDGVLELAITSAGSDIAILKSCFGSQSTSISHTCANADINGDGVVNYADLALFKSASEFDLNGDGKVDFSNTNAPVITRVSPTSAGNGTTITIYGTDLSGATFINFYNLSNFLGAQEIPSTVSATQITLVINQVLAGDGPVGAGLIRVVTPNGTSNTLNFTLNEFKPVPVVTSTSAPGNIAFKMYAGSWVNISGRNFSSNNVAGVPSVFIGGIQATVLRVTDSQLHVMVPRALAPAPGRTYKLYVKNGNGTSNTVWIGILNTFGKIVPSTTSINFHANLRDSYYLTVYDMSLKNTSSVPVNVLLSIPNKPKWLNTTNTKMTTLGAGGVLRIKIYTNKDKVTKSGTYTSNLTISGNFTGEPITIPVTFTVGQQASRLPLITSVGAPYTQAGRMTPGGVVILSGQHFLTNRGTAPSVFIGGIKATVNQASESQLNVTAPSTLIIGNTYGIYVDNSGVAVNNVISNALNNKSNVFQVKVVSASKSPPVITSVRAPYTQEGEMTPGGVVLISGRNFLANNVAGVPSVFIGGIKATVNQLTDSLLNITVPGTLTPGNTYGIYVKNYKGVNSNIIQVKISSVVFKKPTITSIQSEGTTGTITAGGRATIYGTGLSGPLTIKIGIVNPKIIKTTGISDSLAVFTVPEYQQPLTASITVTNSSGKTSYYYSVYVLVWRNSVPRSQQTPFKILSFYPTSGRVGSTVTIHGTGFTTGNAKMKPVPYLEFDFGNEKGLYDIVASTTSSTSATIKLPTYMSAGTYKVKGNRSGIFTPEASNTFKVVARSQSALPHISYLSPSSVTAGETMTIHGSNLYGNPFTVDGGNGVFPSAQNPAGTFISFTVPANWSIGTHLLQILQKGTGTKGNAVSFKVISASQSASHNVPTNNVQPTQSNTTNTTTTTTTQTFSSASQGPFSQNLWRGQNSHEVVWLQRLLNKNSQTRIAVSGPGSQGKETGYYGYLTQAAVQNFQCKNHIVCSGSPDSTGYGVVGPKTREKLNELYGQSGGSTSAITGGINTTNISTGKAKKIATLEAQIQQILQVVLQLQQQLAKQAASQ